MSLDPKRITDLGNATGVADADVVPFVDVSDKSMSARGTTKRSTWQKIAESLPFTSRFVAAGSGADQIDITDSGGFYTGTEVEAALQEIGDGTALDGRYAPLFDGAAPQVQANGYLTQLATEVPTSEYVPSGDWTFAGIVWLPAATYQSAFTYIVTGQTGGGVRLGLAKPRNDGTTDVDVLGESAQIAATTNATTIEAAFASPAVVDEDGLYFVLLAVGGSVPRPSIRTATAVYGMVQALTAASTRIVRYSTTDSYTSGFTSTCLASVAGTTFHVGGVRRSL